MLVCSPFRTRQHRTHVQQRRTSIMWRGAAAQQVLRSAASSHRQIAGGLRVQQLFQEARIQRVHIWQRSSLTSADATASMMLRELTPALQRLRSKEGCKDTGREKTHRRHQAHPGRWARGRSPWDSAREPRPRRA